MKKDMTEYTLGVLGWTFHYLFHYLVFMGIMVFAGLIFDFKITSENCHQFLAAFVILEALWCCYEVRKQKKDAQLIRDWEKENKFKL